MNLKLALFVMLDIFAISAVPRFLEQFVLVGASVLLGLVQSQIVLPVLKVQKLAKHHYPLVNLAQEVITVPFQDL